ncbi:hypothetical protein HDU97_003221 [Phlyctochytrium planicorne]|nr:hypothetical protein HDU97_003221 [Phlyctochytrium planicorne]
MKEVKNPPIIKQFIISNGGQMLTVQQSHLKDTKAPDQDEDNWMVVSTRRKKRKPAPAPSKITTPTRKPRPFPQNGLLYSAPSSSGDYTVDRKDAISMDLEQGYDSNEDIDQSCYGDPSTYFHYTTLSKSKYARACVNRALSVIIGNPLLKDKFLVFGSLLTESALLTKTNCQARIPRDLDLMYYEGQEDDVRVSSSEALSWKVGNRKIPDDAYVDRFEESIERLIHTLLMHSKTNFAPPASLTENLAKARSWGLGVIDMTSLRSIRAPEEIDFFRVHVKNTFSESPCPSVKLIVHAKLSIPNLFIRFCIDVMTKEVFIGEPQKVKLRTSFLKEYSENGVKGIARGPGQLVTKIFGSSKLKGKSKKQQENEQGKAIECLTKLFEETFEECLAIPYPTLIAWKLHSCFEEGRFRAKDLYDLSHLLNSAAVKTTYTFDVPSTSETAEFLAPHVKLAFASRGEPPQNIERLLNLSLEIVEANQLEDPKKKKRDWEKSEEEKREEKKKEKEERQKSKEREAAFDDLLSDCRISSWSYSFHDAASVVHDYVVALLAELNVNAKPKFGFAASVREGVDEDMRHKWVVGDEEAKVIEFNDEEYPPLKR